MTAQQDTTTLYRPTGESELALIRASGYRAFPPRLAWQPIFYPVLFEDYARQIARDWNAREGRRGYVTRFAVQRTYLEHFAVHQVGSSQHQEYWIPATELPVFNQHIVGLIEVIAAYPSSPDDPGGAADMPT